MNGDLVQNALVALIVAAAAGFLVMKRVRARRRPTPLCGDCPACASGESAPDEQTLVSIGRRSMQG